MTKKSFKKATPEQEYGLKQYVAKLMKKREDEKTAKREACSSWSKFPAEYTVDKGVTQSLLSNAMACPRKLWFMLNRFYNPANEGTFGFGRVMHALLDGMYSGKIKTDDDIYKALDETEDKAGIAEPRTLALASALGRAYLVQYSKELAAAGTTYTPEAVFSIPAGKRTFKGRRDVAVHTKAGVALMEHKFWSMIDPEQIVNTLAYDFQVNFYAWTYWVETGSMPSNILYNIIRKPQNKLNKEGDVKEFEQRVFDAVCKEPAYYFYRIPIAVSKKSMARFEVDLFAKLDRLDGILASNETWRNEFACAAKFPCEYRDACFNENVKLLRQHQNLFNELEDA